MILLYKECLISMYKYDDFNCRVYSVIPNQARILDIGCATGTLGTEIKANKAPRQLIGIEIDKRSADKALRFYDKVLVMDVEKTVRLPFKRKSFDCIVLADILEHLRDPESLLKTVSKYLADDGVLIVSVPNVAFISIRISLGVGRFEYHEKGIMDKSHLHFFTLASFQKLIQDSGFQIISVRGYINTRKQLNFLDMLAKLFPTIFAYQFLLIARKSKLKQFH